eukprot:TRINITY_DN4134_c0_g2_i1.p1 TRINITY_DN4134_c0_g2~~TRINITY_DN4134_c0_g2_i1.p1  ORF type:complete len:352 (-),score=67.22 TRINITY_DN4134_c0_g2_i1:175-1230(-)
MTSAMQPSRTSSTMLKPLQASQTLKSAATSSLKLPPGQQTLKGSRTMLKDIESDAVSFSELKGHIARVRKSGMNAVPPPVPSSKTGLRTVWDDTPPVPGKQADSLQYFGSAVAKMQPVFEGVTRLKQEKAQMMDDMHEHTMEKVDETRDYMETMLAKMAALVGEFSAEWAEKLETQMGELDHEMRERIAGLDARCEVVEQRARALQAAIDEETAARIRETEAMLIPIREGVLKLSEELEVEQEIRTNREAELQAHLEETLKLIQESFDAERANRVDRHSEAVKEYEVELQRLEKKHAQITKRGDDMMAKAKEELASEHELRVKGQDLIVERIEDFIKRFQMHVLEEGQMGN